MSGANRTPLLRWGVVSFFRLKQNSKPWLFLEPGLVWPLLRESLGNVDWVNADDDDFILRGKALALFQEGQGYKRVSTVLQLPTSRVKYWYQQFKFNHLDFFEVGQRTFKAYPKAYKEEILQAYKTSSLSKKAFCGQHKIAVVTLNQWLKTNEKNA